MKRHFAVSALSLTVLTLILETRIIGPYWISYCPPSSWAKSTELFPPRTQQISQNLSAEPIKTNK